METKFGTDEELPLNKIIKIPVIAIVVRVVSIFFVNNKYIGDIRTDCYKSYTRKLDIFINFGNLSVLIFGSKRS